MFFNIQYDSLGIVENNDTKLWSNYPRRLWYRVHTETLFGRISRVYSVLNLILKIFYQPLNFMSERSVLQNQLLSSVCLLPGYSNTTSIFQR